MLIAGLASGTGCKKAAKKDAAKGAETAPAKTMGAAGATMDAKEARPVAKDGTKKNVAGMPGPATRGGVAGTSPTGGTTTTPPAPTPPRPAAGPVTVQLVLGLNIAKLRKTFLWKQLLSLKMVQTVLSGKTYTQLKTALGKDPIQLVDSAHVLLGGTSLNDIKKPEHLAISISGRFDAGATLKKLMSIPVTPGMPKPALTKINGKDAIRGKGKKGDGFALVAMNKNTIVMCSESMLPIVTRGDITGGSAAIKAQIKALDPKSLAWLVFGGVTVPLGNAGAVPALAALKKIQGGSVVLSNGKARWTLVNRLDVGTPQAANSLMQLANMMKMTLGKGGAGAGNAPAAMGAILKNLTVVTQGQILIGTIALPEAAVKKLVGSVLSKL